MDYISYILETTQLANEGSFEESIDYFKVNKLDSHLLYLIYKKDKLEDEDKKFIKEAVLFLQNIYNNSFYDSPISDYDYDKLYEINKDITGEDFVGSLVYSDTETYHEYPDLRGSLDKIHFITEEERGDDKRKSYEGWINSISSRYKQATDKVLDLSTVDIILTPKFDGVSVIFELNNMMIMRALLRGEVSSNRSDDISDIFKNTSLSYSFMKDMNGQHGLKTEVVMTEHSYKKMCKKVKEFNSPRSAVVSILNNKDIGYISKTSKYLTIMGLQSQNKDTKEVSVNSFVEYSDKRININDLEALRKEIMNITIVAAEKELPIDGVVIRIADNSIVDVLGRRNDTGINNFEVAYKFPPPRAKTKLRFIDFSMGKFGNLTPVAKIQPVVLNGNTISSISIGSIDRLRKLNLSREDEVIITYDIIPYLMVDETCKRHKHKPIKIPTICPVCEKDLHGDDELKCINESCPINIKGKILNYIGKMDIKNISYSTIDTLYDLGVLESIEDIYSLEKSRKLLTYQKGFGDKKVDNILKSIDVRRSIKDYDLLGSIGIEGIGRTVFKNICSQYTIDEILEFSEVRNMNVFMDMKGIKEKTAEKIVEGVHKNRRLIKFLVGELSVRSSSDREDVMKSYVSFTKVRDSDFEEFLLTKQIGTIELSKNMTKILIVPDNPISSVKTSRAKKWGITMMRISDAYKSFGYKK